jgi:predicted ArsR family transcriptional regulator
MLLHSYYDMDSDRIVLDRESFRALAVDSRINILKYLDERPHTLTELAAALELSHGTVKEHLEVLEGSGLILKNDEGRKWKYYVLTDKGKTLINPREARVFFSFMLSLVATLVLGLSLMIRKFLGAEPQQMVMRAETASDMMILAEEAPHLVQTPDALVIVFFVMAVITIVLFVIAARAERSKIV